MDLYNEQLSLSPCIPLIYHTSNTCCEVISEIDGNNVGILINWLTKAKLEFSLVSRFNLVRTFILMDYQFLFLRNVVMLKQVRAFYNLCLVSVASLTWCNKVLNIWFESFPEEYLICSNHFWKKWVISVRHNDTPIKYFVSIQNPTPYIQFL